MYTAMHHCEQPSLPSRDSICVWLIHKLSEYLQIESAEIDIHTPFAAYGLASLDAVSLVGELEDWLGSHLSVTLFYDYPTIDQLASTLVSPPTSATTRPAGTTSPLHVQEAIAIIGIGCRFPASANDPNAFWHFLAEGKCATTLIPGERWKNDTFYDPDPTAAGKMYTRFGNFLDDLNHFDAHFFGISPHEAERMDPQQRLLAEVTWEALEHAGIAIDTLRGSQTGVFIGMMTSGEYAQLQLHHQADEAINDPYYSTGSAASITSGRLSYLMDLQGPNITVDTACSSSLVALHLACQSLRNGECDLAIVGGVNAILRPETMINACKMGMLAPDGYCKTFDRDADGFVLGEGCGVVILKRWSDVQQHQDTPLALIRGSAINQDGRSNGMTAPNRQAQERVIQSALQRAAVAAADVDYVEAHGSGTALGDPIEIEALHSVYGQQRLAEHPLHVGAVKTNIGHLAGAAGIAGLIKTVLALHNQVIPAHLHVQTPNPHVDWEHIPITIPTTSQSWPAQNRPRYAGISSFGWSGTNAHVILEEAPHTRTPSDELTQLPTYPAHLLLLSAKTPMALEKVQKRLDSFIHTHPEVSIEAIARTTQLGRSALNHRRVIVCSDRDHALSVMRERHFIERADRHETASVIFFFPGTGATSLDVAQELYAQEPLFRECVDRCCTFLTSCIGDDIRHVWDASIPPQMKLAEPAVFVLDYALAHLLMHWGIHPQAMFGYGVGEYVAACLAGVLVLEDALALVAHRATLLQALPRGDALTVTLSEHQIQSYLSDGLHLVAVTTPTTCVVAGTPSMIAQLQQRLTQDGVRCGSDETSQIFRSLLLTTVAQELTQYVDQVSLQLPHIPYISNVTGTWITAEQATNSTYWAEHMCRPLRFVDGITTLLKDMAPALFLEVGPANILTPCVLQTAATSTCPQAIIDMIVCGYAYKEHPSHYTSLLTALANLWLHGVHIDWQAVHASRSLQRIALPSYPFEHQRYWIPSSMHSMDTVQLSSAKRRNIADWFYRPSWQESTRVPPLDVSSRQRAAPYLIFMDDQGFAENLIRELAQAHIPHIVVYAGKHYTQRDEICFTVRPQEQTDYQQLFETLTSMGCFPATIIHCWGVTKRHVPGSCTLEHFERMQEHSFYSVIALTQGLVATNDRLVDLLLIANQLHAFADDDYPAPEKAPLLAACTVIPQEHSQIRCRSIDLSSEQSMDESSMSEWVLTEGFMPSSERIVAYRHGKRWLQNVAPIPLEQAEPHTLPLRPHGVYLITGGLGAIGLVLAEYLARTVQAKIILLGRTMLPPRDTWEALLQDDDPSSRTMAIINKLQEIESLGAEVLPLQADVADAQQMHNVIAKIYQRFGVLHGVLHAAGNTNPAAFSPIAQLDATTCDLHFRPKVAGTLVLEQVLDGLDLDFCLLFSSISAFLGGLNFASYAAGNLFLDAYVHYRNHYQKGTPWCSVNWDSWQLGSEKEDSLLMGSAVAAYAMNEQEGIEAFERILAQQTYTHLINSTGDLSVRMQQWCQLDTPMDLEDTAISDMPAPLQTGVTRITSDTVVNNQNYEQVVTEVWKKALGVADIRPDDNFFDLGGNSLIGLQVIAQLQKRLHRSIPNVALFEAPTINAFVNYLLSSSPNAAPQALSAASDQRRINQDKETSSTDIAIIGMSVRFPGASTVDAFWNNLRDGVESISFFSTEELIAAGVDPASVHLPHYIKARPILSPEEVECFDATFFDYSPREATLTDPQHRLFLECAWEALEHASYNPETYTGLIGVYAGNNLSTALLSLVQTNMMKHTDDYQLVIGHDKDSLTTTASYKFNLRGPSFAVQTFCSTSLVATHLACQSLKAGECDIALAGGVSLRVPTKSGYFYEEGGMESNDGHCRAFDAQACGTLFGDGAGVIVLKRLDDAVKDGDHICAVIKGSAINNDGSLKVSYSAPSVVGQAEVVARALAAAHVEAESIGFVEAHGTGTELGDPIEVTALTRAFRHDTEQKNYCALGSVKTNIGHLDRAAGIAGLIKAVLALQHQAIPPTLHFQTPNPEIDFANSPFFVNTQLMPWDTQTSPRRAGINSLGMGGTNAHIVLEEAPQQPCSPDTRPWQLFLLSARTNTALRQATCRLEHYLQHHSKTPLADVAYTLQVGRKQFEHRRMFVCQSQPEDVIEHLTQDELHGVFNQVETRTDRKVAFLFPGVGEQFPGMAYDLYQTEPSFREIVDHCCALFHDIAEQDLQTLLFATPQSAQPSPRSLRALLGRHGTNSEDSAPQGPPHPLTNTAIAQPAVFIIEYALARLLIQWGIVPQAMLGYSLGEYVAATLAGVFSLQDAMTLVVQRARLIDSLTAGAMTTVFLSAQAVQPYLNDQVQLAVINGPTTCVLSGTIEAINQIELCLDKDEIAYRRIETTHAFHSATLVPLKERLTQLVSTLTLHPPSIPYISNISGTWITDEQASDPAYWAKHMCQTVCFGDGIEQLLQQKATLLVEVGIGQTLGSFVRQHSACSQERMAEIFATQPSRYDQQNGHSLLLTTIGKLWLSGVTIDWCGYYRHEKRLRVPLPTYPFERQRYWIAIEDWRKELQLETPTSPEITTLNEQARIQNMADWFSVQTWKQLPPSIGVLDKPSPDHWLLFLDQHSIGSAIARKLRGQGHRVTVVLPGNAFGQEGEACYTLSPTKRDQYHLLLQTLAEQAGLPSHIVHLWSITSPTVPIQYDLDHGFYSLLALTQVFAELDHEHRTMSVITTGIYDVLGHEHLCPAHATLIGPCRVIPQECANLSCRLIELIHADTAPTEHVLDLLTTELLRKDSEPVVAIRGQHRWVPMQESCRIEVPPSQHVPLRNEGVYLITGGLGGIGLALAEHLAHTKQARLVLTSRTGLPDRAQWPALLHEHPESSRLTQQIRAIMHMEAQGAQVLVMDADVTDEVRMCEVIEQIVRTFGNLHGVLHTAGVPGKGLIQLKTPAMAASVLAAKVQGTLVLERVLATQELDFLILFSSITALTGGPGQVDYCAANAFLDTYARCHHHRHGVTMSINWSEWQWNAWEEGLAGYGETMRHFFEENRRKFGITSNEGAAVVERLLTFPLPQVVVSTQDFQALLDLSHNLTATTIFRQEPSTTTPVIQVERTLNTTYVAPRNELERNIAHMWEEILGVATVGIHDNFFDMGGNSLIGIQLIVRMRKAFKYDTLPNYMLYEAPSVAAMAQYLSQNEQEADQVEAVDERSHKRRTNLKKRMRERVK
ncbi:MAG: SDR family NAD(P)-dependent oxidoreductase [Chloroflexota bacterium]